MDKHRPPWWGCIRHIVRAYPGRRGMELSGTALADQKAVQAAIEAMERTSNGAARLNVIRMVHWDRTHTLGQQLRQDGNGNSLRRLPETAICWIEG